MKVRDGQIMHELIKRRKVGKGLKRLLFVNKRGMIIDIDAVIAEVNAKRGLIDEKAEKTPR